MTTLLKLALAVGALAAVWAFVPVGERTLSERWREAGSLERFARDSLADLHASFGAEPEAAPAKPPAAKSARAPAQARAPRPAREAARPAEGHTDADRRALDRILADRLKD